MSPSFISMGQNNNNSKKQKKKKKKKKRKIKRKKRKRKEKEKAVVLFAIVFSAWIKTTNRSFHLAAPSFNTATRRF
jgi:predicted dinucleotide-binding enzyme